MQEKRNYSIKGSLDKNEKIKDKDSNQKVK